MTRRKEPWAPSGSDTSKLLGAAVTGFRLAGPSPFMLSKSVGDCALSNSAFLLKKNDEFLLKTKPEPASKAKSLEETNCSRLRIMHYHWRSLHILINTQECSQAQTRQISRGLIASWHEIYCSQVNFIIQMSRWEETQKYLMKYAFPFGSVT